MFVLNSSKGIFFSRQVLYSVQTNSTISCYLLQPLASMQIQILLAVTAALLGATYAAETPSKSYASFRCNEQIEIENSESSKYLGGNTTFYGVTTAFAD